MKSLQTQILELKIGQLRAQLSQDETNLMFHKTLSKRLDVIQRALYRSSLVAMIEDPEERFREAEKLALLIHPEGSELSEIVTDMKKAIASAESHHEHLAAEIAALQSQIGELEG